MPTGIRPAPFASAAAHLLALACPLSAGSNPGAAQRFRRLAAEESHLGTLVRIEACVPVEVAPPAAFRAAFKRVTALERILSSYRPDSELRILELSAWRHPVPVSRDLASVLASALRLARHSRGSFDPTLGRATRTLRASGWLAEVRDQSALRAALDQRDWRHVVLDHGSRTVFLNRRGLALDLGGIAKGYIADQALAALARIGVKRAIVAIAGDIAVGEAPPGQAGWRIALDATGERGIAERTLVLRNAAVSTSGSRERYYLLAGRKCSHILGVDDDGCTVPTHAVSVVAPSAAVADGLATALAATGPDSAASLLRRYPRARAYWAVEAAGRTSRQPLRGFSRR